MQLVDIATKLRDKLQETLPSVTPHLVGNRRKENRRAETLALFPSLGCEEDQGSISRRFRKVFGPGKP